MIEISIAFRNIFDMSVNLLKKIIFEIPQKIFDRSDKIRLEGIFRTRKIFEGIKTPLLIDTCKHLWIICLTSGNAQSVPKGKINFFIKLLFYSKVKKIKSTQYSYFTSASHIKWSIKDGERFLSKIIDPNNISLNGKNVLDISGGNGHTAKLIEDRGARVTLTEYEPSAVYYARDVLNLDAVQYDFQKDSLSDVVTGKYDIVLLRAAVMFCRDLDELLNEIRKITNPGALIVMQYCVVPSLGVLLVTQCDDYNYLNLYQPETLIEYCEKHGIKLVNKEFEIDSDDYVYGTDKSYRETLIKMYYELKAVKKLPFHSKFQFRARDRRRYNLIFRIEG